MKNTSTRMQDLIDFTKEAWEGFKKLHPESEYFKIQIDLIDGFLGKLHYEFGFTPPWIKEYHHRRMHYWNPMKVRLCSEMDPTDHDLDINFTFRSNNVECEFILN